MSLDLFKDNGKCVVMRGRERDDDVGIAVVRILCAR